MGAVRTMLALGDASLEPLRSNGIWDVDGDAFHAIMWGLGWDLGTPLAVLHRDTTGVIQPVFVYNPPTPSSMQMY